jgi:hypothetical protein
MLQHSTAQQIRATQSRAAATVKLQLQRAYLLADSRRHLAPPTASLAAHLAAQPLTAAHTAAPLTVVPRTTTVPLTAATRGGLLVRMTLSHPPTAQRSTADQSSSGSAGTRCNRPTSCTLSVTSHGIPSCSASGNASCSAAPGGCAPNSGAHGGATDGAAPDGVNHDRATDGGAPDGGDHGTDG